MTDRIEDLFTGLRAETLPTVRPPGTAPLRRAAQRRRAALSGAAALAVLAVAGLAAAIQPGHDSVPVASPAEGPFQTAPVYTAETLKARVAESLKIDDPEHPEPGEIVTAFGSVPHEAGRVLPGGTYDIRLTCYGSGGMSVTTSTGAVGQVPMVVVQDVPCETTSTLVISVPIVVPGPSGTVMVRIEPHVAGPGRAAFGWTARPA
ncbi:hypothetical protein [Actinoplanes sp. GCM10030250]|uniref:hypothetical protein n=1 Tax=Actinoplanes sp. GCM10030250 TaxID=3273376 RepID=UPI003610E839